MNKPPDIRGTYNHDNKHYDKCEVLQSQLVELFSHYITCDCTIDQPLNHSVKYLLVHKFGTYRNLSAYIKYAQETRSYFVTLSFVTPSVQQQTWISMTRKQTPSVMQFKTGIINLSFPIPEVNSFLLTKAELDYFCIPLSGYLQVFEPHSPLEIPLVNNFGKVLRSFFSKMLTTAATKDVMPPVTKPEPDTLEVFDKFFGSVSLIVNETIVKVINKELPFSDQENCDEDNDATTSEDNSEGSSNKPRKKRKRSVSYYERVCAGEVFPDTRNLSATLEERLPPDKVIGCRVKLNDQFDRARLVKIKHDICNLAQ